mmetsp:Transcript_42173/g.48963  ORF Transcript_42173/g.48963 Transcript_42173/m.48963 type:complete len:182 (-) Transcript_42173:963-1508(-)
MSGYTLSGGTCSASSGSSGSSGSSSSSTGSSSSTTTTSSYLYRDVESVSAAGVGTPIAAALAVSIGVSIASGATPVVAGLGISQCQSIQTLSMLNMNTPNNYVQYSQGYEITKLNFKFVNFVGLQSSLDSKTRRNLSTGYTSLTNIGFYSGHFLVNYIYFFLALVLAGLAHLVIMLLQCCC